MNSLSIAVVIPNFNRKDDILEELKSLYIQDYDQSKIIVVDDNSSDGSVDVIKKTFPQTQIIALEKNGGPAVARNAGIKNAKENIIIGIDSDVVLPDKHTLANIATKFSSSPRINCISFRILNYYDRSDDIKTWWHPFPIETHAGRIFYTDYFSGTGYAFRRNIFDKAGYFPEDLFMHGEENELSLRILDSGFDILYCPDIVVLHKCSVQSRNKLIPYYYKRRNQIWIVAKCYPALRGVCFMVPRLVKTLFESLLKGQFVNYCRALYDAIRGLPIILKKRMPLKKETWKKIRLIRCGQYNALNTVD